MKGFGFRVSKVGLHRVWGLGFGVLSAASRAEHGGCRVKGLV